LPAAAIGLAADALHPRRRRANRRLPSDSRLATRGATVKVCVCGLWHLGTVIAACLASAGHDVVGLDDDVQKLRVGEPPLFEPGLAQLIRAGLDRGTLRFTSNRAALRDAEAVWIAWDTPVDEDDRADVEFVLSRAESLFPFLSD